MEVDEAERWEFGGAGADLEEEIVFFDGVPQAVVEGAAFVTDEADGVPGFLVVRPDGRRRGGRWR